MVDCFWRGDTPSCPSDGTPLVVTKSEAIGGEYTLMALCRRCGTNAQMTRADDPYRSEFGPWSDDDKAYIADNALDQRPIKCPSDSTPLQPTMRPDGLKTVVRVRCGRCGQSLSQTFPRDS